VKPNRNQAGVIPAGLRSGQGGHYLKSSRRQSGHKPSRSGCVVVTQSDIVQLSALQRICEMLVLALKHGEAVVLPGLGRIVFIESNKKTGRIGFELNREQAVIREELLVKDLRTFHAAPDFDSATA
jgi:sRNA-binding carbon storage regulator CsrA